MKEKTCFVVMAIGDQDYNGQKVTAHDLKRKYDDLIKEALLRVNPQLNVVRADEIALPGSISSDILTHIMHADYVVADVTYPNPNVYYELGLRHASRAGTVIIKDSSGPRVPFDISHLRHFEYENTPTGLKMLSENLKNYFDISSRFPDRPDNQFMELAKLTRYKYPDFSEKTNDDPVMTAIMSMMASPETMELLLKAGNGEEVNPGELLATLFQNPAVGQNVLKAMFATGQLDPQDIFGQKAQKRLPRSKK